MSVIKKFIERENRYSAIGEASADSSAEASIYVSRAVKGDGRKATAQVESNPEVHYLQIVRTKLQRGSLAEAEALLQAALHEAIDNEDLVEIYLELARSASFHGDWRRALQHSQRSLELEPPAITQMTLRQIRALAFFEIGDFASALKEIESAQNFMRLFTHGTLPIFVELTHVKVLIHVGEAARVGRKLQRLWERVSEGASIEFIIALMRSQVELDRARGLAVADACFAVFLLTDWSGHSLYHALAVVDIYFSLSDSKRGAWSSRIDLAARDFGRVQSLLTGEATSSRKFLERSLGEEKVLLPESAESIDEIILIKQGLAVDRDSLRVRKLSLSHQMRLALAALVDGQVSKPEFFAKVWGDQKFVPHLHDSVIRSLLHRMRKSAGVQIETRDSLVVLPYVLVVNV